MQRTADSPTTGPDSTGSTVLAMFTDPAAATRAIDALAAAGFGRDRVSLAVRDTDTAQELRRHTGTAAGEGAAAGAVSGGVAGGALGLLAALGAVAIPGIGAAVAAGWLATAVVGAGVGAAAGGLVGSLIGLGVPEADATRFDAAFRRGGILLAVESGGRADEAAAILETHQADVSGAHRR